MKKPANRRLVVVSATWTIDYRVRKSTSESHIESAKTLTRKDLGTAWGTHAVDEKVQVVGDEPLSVQQAPLSLLVPITPRGALQAHHPLQDGILVLVQKVGQLGRVDRRVELQERPHRRYAQLDLDVLDEQVGLPDERVLRRFRDPGGERVVVLVRRRDGGEELGTGTQEQFPEGGDGGLFLAALHGCELFAVSLLDGVHDPIVRRAGGQGGTDGQEGVHPLALLGDRTVLVTPGVVLLHPVEEDQDRDKDLNGVRVSSESHVGESDVVVGGDVTGGDLGQERVVAQIHVLHGLQGDCGSARSACRRGPQLPSGITHG
jgi:hypothetical protein